MNLDCILCGSAGAPGENLSRTFRDDDSGRYRIARCAACGHAQVTPLPSEEEEAAYYARDMQPRALWKDGNYYEIVRERARIETNRRLAWLATALAPATTGSVLDVGSGYGFFVDALANAGFDAHGLEVSDDRLRLARRNMSGTFHHGQADDAFVRDNAGRFAAVTAFHVIEHVRDPVGYFSHLLRLAAPGGRILVEVPNLDDAMAGEIPEYAEHMWQIAHLNYFDAPHLEMALRKAGVGDFRVAGVQRYGLRHLVTWTDTHAPDLTGGAPKASTPLFDRIEALYRAERECDMTCDTLIATVRL